MTFNSTRRALLKAASANGGYLALRSLVTGLPASVLLGGLPTDKAIAQASARPQFLLMALNHTGHPINNNCPGVYDNPFDGVYHNKNASMKPQTVLIGGQSYTAAKPWRDLQNAVPWAMERMSFIHHTTRTNIHSQYAGVMKLMGSSRGPNGETNSPEFLPSMIASGLAPLHNAIQEAPLYLGGPNVDFSGQALGRISANSLQRLFPSLDSTEKVIRQLRDADLEKLNNALKNGASRKQKAWLDDHVRSLDELRQLDEKLISEFSKINNASEQSSIDAAIVAFKLNITSAATIHIDFGGDNHNDPSLSEEANKTVNGCKTLAYLFNRLKQEGLEDDVTFASFGVFGRTLTKKGNGDGRDHNLHHHVTLLAGKHVNPSVIGGIQPVANGFGAMPINARTGEGTAMGDIPLDESLESTAKTIAAATGLDLAVMRMRIRRSENGEEKQVGKIIGAAVKV